MSWDHSIGQPTHPEMRVHVTGNWPATALRSHWVPSRLRHTAAQRAAIDAHWATANARPGVHLFDGPLCRLESLTMTANTIDFGLSPTSYRIYLGSHAAHPEWADQDDRTAMADALGTSVALISSDGWAVFGVRGAHLALYPGCAHPVGGTLEVGDGVTPVDIAKEMMREISEETGLATDLITDLRLIALFEDLRLRQPELAFVANVRCDRARLETCLAQDEHSAAWSVRCESSALNAALTADQPMTPVLRGMLTTLAEAVG